MRARREERGAAMLWAMALLVVAGSLAALFVEREQALRRDATNDATALETFHAVEGALAHARHTLARDPLYAGGSVEIGDTLIQTVVTRDGVSGWTVELRAPGRGRGLRARLRVRPGLPRVASRSTL